MHYEGAANLAVYTCYAAGTAAGSLVATDPTRLALAREAAEKFPAQYEKLRRALAELGVTL